MDTRQHLLFVGGYAAAHEPGIQAFFFNAATGALTPGAAYAGIANPSFLAIHPRARCLYAVSETDAQRDGAPGAVWALQFTEAGGDLQPLNHQASGGDWPCHLRIDPTGRWLLVTNYASGSVATLPILAGGALGAPTDLVQHRGRGPHPERQDGPHTHSTIFTPDDRFLIVADLGIDQLVVYRFDSTAGRLLIHGDAPTRPGAGPRHMAFDPAGRWLYVANELDNTVARYDYDPAAGRLRVRQIAATVSAPASESTVADIHLAAAGQRLYVSNRGDDSLAVFDIGPDGGLSPVAVAPCGGHWPRNFAIAPGGRFLVVANHHSDEVVVLPVLDGAAALGPPVARAAIPGAACVQFIARRS